MVIPRLEPDNDCQTGPGEVGCAPPELDALEHLQLAAGMRFDRLAADQALAQSAQEHPGAISDVWEALLRGAAQRLGLVVTGSDWTPRQAASQAAPDAPVVGYGMDGPVLGWLVLVARRGRKVLLAPIDRDRKARWVTLDELARTVGAASPDSPARWVTAHAGPAATSADEVIYEGGEGHEHEGHHEHVPPLRRLFRLIWPERGDLLVVGLFAFGVGVLSLAAPILISELVNSVMFSVLMQQVIVLAVLLFVFLSLAAGMQALQVIVVEYLQQRLFVRVTADFAYRLPRSRPEAFESTHAPELVNRFFDVLTVQKSAATLLLDGTAIVLQTAIGLSVLGFYHPALLVFDTGLILFIVVGVFVLGRGAVASGIQESRAKYGVAAWLEEVARHPNAFKTAGGTDYAWARADHLAREYLLARRSHFKIVFRQVAFFLLMQVVTSTALLGLGGWLVIQQQLTIGQLVAAELIVALVVSSFTKLGKYLDSYYDLLAAVDKLGHVTDLPLERITGDGLPPRSGRGASVILNDVSYGTGERNTVLQGLTLTVSPGDRVALVGPHGSGKSVITDMLYGLRMPDEGRIELDGVDLRDVRLDVLREQVALVRGIEVFDGTIVDNLRMGRPHLTMVDLRHALAAVGLLEDVLALPAGFQTRLTTGGRPLSLSQSLRLMMARVLLSRPRLLLLDGVLDYLDPSNTRSLMETLFSPTAPWTLVVVTRDPEIQRRCDRRVVLARMHPGLPSTVWSEGDADEDEPASVAGRDGQG